jgi:hypothetical protein
MKCENSSPPFPLPKRAVLAHLDSALTSEVADAKPAPAWAKLPFSYSFFQRLSLLAPPALGKDITAKR